MNSILLYGFKLIKARCHVPARMACRCFWDQNTDSYAQEVYSNVRMAHIFFSALGIIWLHIFQWGSWEMGMGRLMESSNEWATCGPSRQTGG